MQRPASSVRELQRAAGVRLITLLATATFAACAFGQSAVPAAFVGNNGNLEGSVTSFTFDAAGAPVFVQRIITGTRNSTVEPGPGCNVYAVSLTPNGRFLATCHATGEWATEQITIFRIHADATFSQIGAYTTPDGPLDIQWINDELLAVLKTSLSATNLVYVYRYDPDVPSFTLVGSATAGTFTGYLAVHPSGPWVYAGDSFQNRIYVYEVAPDGGLTQIQSAPSTYYPLGITMSPNGDLLYAGGGISGDGNRVIGFYVDPATGLVTAMSGSFTSPGESPKDCAFSSDGSVLFVSHGTDSTVRSFLIDSETGALTYTGNSFDVGIQGSVGDHAVLGDKLLITDNFDGPTGLYSFDYLPDGSFSMNGGLVSSQGIAPREIAAWIPPPPCPADLNDDGVIDLDDLSLLLVAFGSCTGEPGFNAAADLDGDGCIDLDDLSELLVVFGTSCA